jgi:argininosuccinate lyase
MNHLHITAIALTLSLVAIAEARPRSPGVNRRQANQQDRIRDGVKSGELTGREARTLEWKEARVAELERRLKADGTLSPSERARLQSELTDLSREIYQQKHDAQKRPAVAPGTADPGINARQAAQQARIGEGVKSGALTPRETKILEAKEARVAHLEKRLKSDGKLTAAERAKLQHELDELSKDIRRQKHDAQTR